MALSICLKESPMPCTSQFSSILVVFLGSARHALISRGLLGLFPLGVFKASPALPDESAGDQHVGNAGELTFQDTKTFSLLLSGVFNSLLRVLVGV